LKVLFQVEVGRLPPEDVLEMAFEEVHPSEEEQNYVAHVARGVLQELKALDAIIGDLAEGWRLERLAKVDKTLLRMALYELIHRPETPVSVVINDAVEIAKKYSTEDSGRFVNGILGSFVRRRDGGAGAAGMDPN